MVERSVCNGKAKGSIPLSSISFFSLIGVIGLSAKSHGLQTMSTTSATTFICPRRCWPHVPFLGLDPFIDIVTFHEGITKQNIDCFMDGLDMPRGRWHLRNETAKRFEAYL